MNSSDPPMDAWQLLESCNNETSCFLATPTQTFLGQGIREQLSITNGAIPHHDLPRQAMTLLEKHSRSSLPLAPLMGALPFDDNGAVHLFIPEQIYRARPLRKISAAAKPKHSNQNQCTLQMIPSPSIYMQGVEQGLELIHRSQLLKIVLSRSLELSFAKALDLGGLLANLARGNRHGYTYLINLSRPQETYVCSENSQNSHWLIGASPELLVFTLHHQDR